MDIYEALTRDHNKLKALLNQLVEATEANEKTKDLLGSIRDELIPHSRAEEAVFYNPLREIDEYKSQIRESYAEHAAAESLLRTLQGLDSINVEWTKAAQQLKDSIEKHIEEEENQVFAMAKKVLLDEEAKQIASAFERLKPEVREQGFLQNTLDLVSNMMPKRFIEGFRSMNKNG